MSEEITSFGDTSLVGVLREPDEMVTPDLPGIVLLNPGLLHRVGPNRLYVKLARALVMDGYSVLSFDFSGLGDSPPRADNLPRERSAVAETIAAIDHLIDRTGCATVVLIGHCSGALLSLLSAFSEERVAGVVAISPEGGDEGWVEFDRRQKEARYYTNYYARAALHDTGRWRRLLTGRADYSSIARNVFHGMIVNRIAALGYTRRSSHGTTARDAEVRPEVQAFKQGLRTLADRRLPILLVHPDQSAGPELLRTLLGTTIDDLRAAGSLEIATISASDHMFTPLAAQRDLIETTREWVSTIQTPLPLTTSVSNGSL